MYIPQDFKELIDVVQGCNQIRDVLQKVKQIAAQTDESNFKIQSDSITAICDAALENKPKILSKTKSELLEDYEYHIESILSGEFNEQFDV